jgi:hypothetical protein
MDIVAAEIVAAERVAGLDIRIAVVVGVVEDSNLAEPFGQDSPFEEAEIAVASLAAAAADSQMAEADHSQAETHTLAVAEQDNLVAEVVVHHKNCHCLDTLRTQKKIFLRKKK